MANQDKTSADHFDVVIAGSGLAGLCAALEANAAGRRVVILEKSPASGIGGGSRMSGGLFAVPNATSPTGKADYVDDFLKKSGGKGNRRTFEIMADHAIDDIEWLKSQGVRLTPAEPVAPYRVYGVFAHPGQAAGMPDLIDGLARRLKEKGGTILFDTKVQDLIRDDAQTVCGVTAIGPDGATRQFRAKAVILASGGYSASSSLLEKHVGKAAGQLTVRGARSCTGDGLKLAQQLGAATVNLDGLSSIHVAAVSVKDPISGNPFQAIPHCISINGQGKRFVDESLGYVSHGKAALNQKPQRAALVFDDALRKNPGVESSVAVFRRLGVNVVEADSIADLAAKIDVPAATLADTIRTFNTAVSNGAAPTADPPKKMYANKIEGPRYYAFYPLSPGVTLSFGGLVTNELGQVVKQDGKLIAGLYAVGEIGGGEFFNDYIGGGSLSKCLVMGRIAGRNAAKQ